MQTFQFPYESGRWSAAHLIVQEVVHLAGGPVVRHHLQGHNDSCIQETFITLKPWSFMLRMRFWPMTANPMRAMSASPSVILHTVAELPIGLLCEVLVKRQESLDERNPRQLLLCPSVQIKSQAFSITPLCDPPPHMIA